SALGIDSDSLTARRFRAAVTGESLMSLSPAEQLERGEERHYPPAKDYHHLRSDGGERRALEHVGPQRVIHGRERQHLDKRLHGIRKVCRREEHSREYP